MERDVVPKWLGSDVSTTTTTISASTGAAAGGPTSYGTLPSYNPPLFFEIVEDGVFRSNKCDASSFPYLATLQLSTIVYLSYDDLSRELVDFFKERDVNVVRAWFEEAHACVEKDGDLLLAALVVALFLCLCVHVCSHSHTTRSTFAAQIHLGQKYRNSAPWKGVSEGMAKEAIEHILDQRRHPILVMCKCVCVSAYYAVEPSITRPRTLRG